MPNTGTGPSLIEIQVIAMGHGPGLNLICTSTGQDLITTYQSKKLVTNQLWYVLRLRTAEYDTYSN